MQPEDVDAVLAIEQDAYPFPWTRNNFCLLYTSDAADERSSVDLGGRRIIKKKKHEELAIWIIDNEELWKKPHVNKRSE